METRLSLNTLQRLPTYLNLLKSKLGTESVNISAKAIADELGLGEIQVRKDLAMVSTGGKPKVGYVIADLIPDIEHALGYNNNNEAVLVGAGKLGKALLSYEGFKNYGLNIVAAFDTDPSVSGRDSSGKEIYPLDKLESICKRLNVRIGIITVPAEHAQEVCDSLISCGIVAVWNFAPANLKTPEHVFIKNENMAASLAVLSNHLAANLTNSADEAEFQE